MKIAFWIGFGGPVGGFTLVCRCKLWVGGCSVRQEGGGAGEEVQRGSVEKEWQAMNGEKMEREGEECK